MWKKLTLKFEMNKNLKSYKASMKNKGILRERL